MSELERRHSASSGWSGEGSRPLGMPFKMKGQQGIMEYVMLTFFVLVIIVALLFFLSWWQASQLGLEKRINAVQRTYSVLGQLINDPVIVKGNSILDDSKLSALQNLDCQEMESIFGQGWYANVTLFEGDARVVCGSNYPNCNYWSFCPENYRGRCSRISYIIPVNIYRKMSESVSVGMLEVGACQ